VKTEYKYFGLETTVIDPDNKAATEVRDYFGRITAVSEWNDAGNPVTTYYVYHAAGT